jgi:hypothetical protein
MHVIGLAFLLVFARHIQRKECMNAISFGCDQDRGAEAIGWQLAHDPEKSEAVFRERSCANNSLKRDGDST